MPRSLSRTLLMSVTLLSTACVGTPVTGQQVPPDERAVRPVTDFEPCDETTNRTEQELAVYATGAERAPKEVHDCQQLVVGGRFGPLVGIYPLVDSLYHDADDFSWRTFASVLNWGDSRYDTLGIAVGANCLLVRRVAGSLEARMDQGYPCPQHGRAIASRSVSLAVVAQTYDGPDEDSDERPIYPSTARFRWRADSAAYYIGIKCGEAWCSLGLERFLPADEPIDGRLFDAMPGYFDEQPLPLLTEHGLVVGPVARIHPEEALRSVGQPGQEQRTDTYARVVLRRPQPGFDVGDLNAVSRHLGLAGKGSARGSLVFRVATRQANVRGWQTNDDRQIELDVEEVVHSGPMTVRWRWMPLAEARERAQSERATEMLQRLVSDANAAGDNDLARRLVRAAVPADAWIPCQADNCCTATW